MQAKIRNQQRSTLPAALNNAWDIGRGQAVDEKARNRQEQIEADVALEPRQQVAMVVEQPAEAEGDDVGSEDQPLGGEAVAVLEVAAHDREDGP